MEVGGGDGGAASASEAEEGEGESSAAEMASESEGSDAAAKLPVRFCVCGWLYMYMMVGPPRVFGGWICMDMVGGTAVMDRLLT